MKAVKAADGDGGVELGRHTLVNALLTFLHELGTPVLVRARQGSSGLVRARQGLVAPRAGGLVGLVEPVGAARMRSRACRLKNVSAAGPRWTALEIRAKP